MKRGEYMMRWLSIAALWLLATTFYVTTPTAKAQASVNITGVAGGGQPSYGTTAPTGACSANQLYVISTTGAFYTCSNGTWATLPAGTGNVTGSGLTANDVITGNGGSAIQDSGIAVSSLSTTATGVLGESAIYASASRISPTPAYLDCSVFPGADDSLKIQACLVALYGLNTISGVADARGLTGGAWSVNPYLASSIPASGFLLLPAGTITECTPFVDHPDWSVAGESARGYVDQVGTTVQANASCFPAAYSTGTITVGTPGANEVITGSGTSWTTGPGGNIQLGETFNTGGGTNSTFGIITAINVGAQTITLGWGANNGTGAAGGSTYNIVPEVHAHGSGGSSNNGDQFGMASIDLNYDCNQVTGCMPDVDWFGNQGSYDEHVGLHGFCNIGLDLEFQFQNSGPWTLIASSPGTGCTAGVLPVVIRGALQALWTFNGLSVSKGASTTLPAIGVDVESNSTNLWNVDAENVAIGISVSSNPTCLFGCAMPGRQANGVAINGAWNYSAGGTTVVQLSNAIGALSDENISNLAKASATNALVDQNNSCTITDSRLAVYVTNHAGKNIQSSSTTCPTVPASATALASNSSNQIVAATLQGTDTKLQTAGTVSGTAATLCTDVNGGTTTVGCTPSGGGIVTYSGLPVVTATAYVPLGGDTIGSTTETNVQMAAPSGASISNLYVVSSAVPGVGNTLVITLRDNTTSQVLTCTITAAATSCNDVTHTFTPLPGDLLDWQITPTGTVVITPNIQISASWGTPPTGVNNNAVISALCIGVVGASSTLYMAPFNAFSATSCTTSATSAIGNGLGFPAPWTGTLKNLQIVASTGGVNSSSGVFTVFLNGSATALTCTTGTAKTCSDLTHTVAITQGQGYSIRFTTQAAETLANVAATMQLQ
jgi:hypothetical protein